MLYATLSVLLLFALCAVHAVRDQHLVVLRWPSGYFFLERGPDGRYALFSPIRTPYVVVRFGVVSLVGAVHTTLRRARSRVEAHLPSAVRGVAAR